MNVIYKDPQGRVCAVYTNCDTATPPANCTRIETAVPVALDEFYKPLPIPQETLEAKIRRIVREEMR